MAEIPLLQLKNFSLFLKNKGEKSLLDDVDFSFTKGETYILQGANGIGKSLFAKSLLGGQEMLPIRLTGQILYKNRDLLTPSTPLTGHNGGSSSHFAYIPQDPPSALTPLKKIAHQLPKLASAPNKFVAEQRIIDLFTQLNLTPAPHFLKRYPHTLSGGEAQRILCAMTLLRNPEFIICDELTASLDAQNKHRIYEILRTYQGKTKATIVFISHDTSPPSFPNAHLITFKNQKIVPLKSAHLSFPAKKTFPAARTQERDLPLLDIKNLSIFPFSKPEKAIPLISNLSFTLYPGQTVGLLGPSGIGKTTVAQTLMQRYPYKGTILWHGKDISKMPGGAPHTLGIRYLFQNPFSAFNPKLTIRSHFEEIFYLLKKSFDKKKVEQLLHRIDMQTTILSKYPFAFSGGELQKIALTLLLLSEPTLAILDEPTSSLDPLQKKEFISFIKAIQSKTHLSILLISHDTEVVKALCDTVIQL